MIWKLRKAGIKMVSGVQTIEALGTQKLEQVRFRKGSMTETLGADLLLLHHGVVPNVQITRLLGCEHQWYEQQRYWEPKVDEWGNTSVKGVSIAGDCGRVAGSNFLSSANPANRRAESHFETNLHDLTIASITMSSHSAQSNQRF